MNEFQNGEVFQFDGIYQASTMYLADAAELGRFDAGRLKTLEREWQAKYDQLPSAEDQFSFAEAVRAYQGNNGELSFMFSVKNKCFVLLSFELKPSTRGRGNVVAIDTGLSRKKSLFTVYGATGIAARRPFDFGHLALRRRLTRSDLLAKLDHGAAGDADLRRLNARLVSFVQALAECAAGCAAEVSARNAARQRALEQALAEILDMHSQPFEALVRFARSRSELEFRLKWTQRVTTVLSGLAAMVLLGVILTDGIQDAGVAIVAVFLGLGAWTAVNSVKVVQGSAKLRKAVRAATPEPAIRVFHHLFGHGPHAT